MITPTDVQGWIRISPVICLVLLGLLGLAGLLEGTERGRRVSDRLIERITRGRSR